MKTGKNLSGWNPVYDCPVCAARLVKLREVDGFATIPALRVSFGCARCGHELQIYFWRPAIRERECAVITTIHGTKSSADATQS